VAPEGFEPGGRLGGAVDVLEGDDGDRARVKRLDRAPGPLGKTTKGSEGAGTPVGLDELPQDAAEERGIPVA
jgi:hypothetical protein